LGRRYLIDSLCRKYPDESHESGNVICKHAALAGDLAVNIFLDAAVNISYYKAVDDSSLDPIKLFEETKNSCLRDLIANRKFISDQ
jgi:hypothetical protein